MILRKPAGQNWQPCIYLGKEDVISNYIFMLTHGDWKQHKWNELGLWKHY